MIPRHATLGSWVAEYALRGLSMPIGVAGWKTELVASLPEEFASSLLSVADIEAELSGLPKDRLSE
ncbi:hypothetical protein [Paenarthrobacter sp. PH39-S1]|uniref:hypothetical protein n=1 Tax=Paenarthrobacter sp. PH39-S1 TaxID=3046204 RepID=UPI0024BAFBBE|nr:hypothetical protein [Paenarthrobacter sp. PH39-S1]MDJ0355439.1 hypothetical protein [Paenarthrobacter sp. PH39-S1]